MCLDNNILITHCLRSLQLQLQLLSTQDAFRYSIKCRSPAFLQLAQPNRCSYMCKMEKKDLNGKNLRWITFTVSCLSDMLRQTTEKHG